MNKKNIVFAIFLLPQLLWFAIIILTPYLACSGYSELADLLYFLFRSTCHQLPSRSFFVFGCKMPVCARCFGIYAGSLAATLLYPFIYSPDNRRMPPKIFLLLALIPIGLDGGLQFITSYESNNILRLLTGLLCGSALVFYILPAYNDLVYGFLEEKHII